MADSQPGTGLGPSPRGAKLLARLRAFMSKHVEPAEATMEVHLPALHLQLSQLPCCMQGRHSPALC